MTLEYYILLNPIMTREGGGEVNFVLRTGGIDLLPLVLRGINKYFKPTKQIRVGLYIYCLTLYNHKSINVSEKV